MKLKSGDVHMCRMHFSGKWGYKAVRAHVRGYKTRPITLSDGAGSANNNTPDSFTILMLLRVHIFIDQAVCCWVKTLWYSLSDE